MKIRGRETTPQRLARRARIILAMGVGRNNSQVAERMGIHCQQVQTWRRRWLEAAARLTAAETEGSERELAELIEEALSDEPRPGGPATFTPEQVARLLAVACEAPEDCGRPVSHWTPRELRDEVIQRGLVEDISIRSVGRFLKGGPSSPTASSIGCTRSRKIPTGLPPR
jgi:putative transposase